MRAMIFPALLLIAGACGSGPDVPPAEPDARLDPPDARGVLLDSAPIPDAASDSAPAPPGCTRAPCPARPIVFVHGYRGSVDDFLPMLTALVRRDERYDGYRLAGTADHDWAPRSLDRRSWLVAFDHYNLRKEDAREAYTAGPGRIGSNRAHACGSPPGQGFVIADAEAYDQAFDHEYAADLAALIDDVLEATGADSVDVVAHSMGGLITRSYMAFHGGSARVHRLLLLASPVEGVDGAGIAGYVGIGAPAWMYDHEIAEIDGGSFLSQIQFSLCDETPASPGSFGGKLLVRELAQPPPVEYYVMSGGLDPLITYGVSDHPLALSHDVVSGATHGGILEDDRTIDRVRELLGGTWE